MLMKDRSIRQTLDDGIVDRIKHGHFSVHHHEDIPIGQNEDEWVGRHAPIALFKLISLRENRREKLLIQRIRIEFIGGIQVLDVIVRRLLATDEENVPCRQCHCGTIPPRARQMTDLLMPIHSIIVSKRTDRILASSQPKYSVLQVGACSAAWLVRIDCQ